ncbi:growth hormone secretagogue receptor type 1-like [Exaiptasia diaphana]|uniref:G-protein coupled receptors family 1 profile domain-containing protein n=1 Tax=Exaiptasia diaphana TaxID=2652724 RepID=A0A913YFS0_EXADI|nr:growth hormone secretagogue receptor type 1-like [Exaiptasia diaphana]
MELEYILYVFFFTAIVLNVIGNSLVIYIICKKPKTSTDHLLLNLAVADLMLGVFQAIQLFSLLSIRLVSNPKPFVIENDIFCRLFTSGNFNWLAYVASTITMLILSSERYFAVCHPHSFKKLFSTRNVKFIIMLSWFLAVVTIIPRNTGKTCFSVDANLSKTLSVIAAIFSMVTLLLISILSAKIYVSLWCKHTVIQPTAVREIQERKMKKRVTLCVLAVVATYIFCNIPLSTWYILFGFQKIQQGAEKLSGQIVILLAVVNSALDPYLFSFQNRRMRELLKKIFRCKNEDQAQEQTIEQRLA